MNLQLIGFTLEDLADIAPNHQGNYYNWLFQCGDNNQITSSEYCDIGCVEDIGPNDNDGCAQSK
jgi:hypothetical protein